MNPWFLHNLSNAFVAVSILLAPDVLPQQRQFVYYGGGRSEVMSYKMKILVNTLQIYLLGSFVLLAPSFAQSAVREGHQPGKVQFRVLMPNDVLIPSLSVTIEGKILRKEIPLSVNDLDDKANLVELPAGIYRVSSRNNNYYAFQRAPFRVEAGTVIKINIFPLIRVQTQMLMADGSDKYEFADEPKYDSFPMLNSSDASLNLLIRYDKKRKRKGFFEYSSNLWEFRGAPEAVSRGVMVSYDAFTVYADKVRFYSRNSTLEAQGNVVIEDGKQRIKLSKATINLKEDLHHIIRNSLSQ